jgi:hypothetical protein
MKREIAESQAHTSSAPSELALLRKTHLDGSETSDVHSSAP